MKNLAKVVAFVLLMVVCSACLTHRLPPCWPYCYGEFEAGDPVEMN